MCDYIVTMDVTMLDISIPIHDRDLTLFLEDKEG